MDRGDAAVAIDLKRLRLFLAMADAGSISGGAAASGVAQPTLSENVAALESRLQTRLAIRGPRGVVLTEAGEALARRGRSLLGTAAALAEDVRRIGGYPHGAVSIGLPPSLGALLGVPLAETVHAELPDVRLRVVEGLSGNVLEWIGSGAVHFGFTYDPPDASAFDSLAVLDEDLFLLCAPDDLPAAALGPAPEIPFAALADLPLVMPSGMHGSRRVVERLARSGGVRLTLVREIDSLPQIIEMVARASSHAIVPHAAVLDQVASGKVTLVRIVQPACRRTAYRVRRRAHGVTAAELSVERVLIAIVREVVRRHALQAAVVVDDRGIPA